MKIIIDNRAADKFRLSLGQLQALYKVAKMTLETENTKRRNSEIPKAPEISLILVDDEEINIVNRNFRQVDRPTDVLSFPLYEAAEPLLPGGSLGDLMISVDTMRRQAAEYGHSQKRELCFLFVHGLLHLLGYDHEISPAEEALQFARQEEVLSALGIDR
ncbi:MAG: rRNA maturation RNase YbeY [Bacillota bacterium]|jgi:probable rRNA maturation factor